MMIFLSSRNLLGLERNLHSSLLDPYKASYTVINWKMFGTINRSEVSWLALTSKVRACYRDLFI